MLKRTLMFLVALTLIEGYWKVVERAIDGYLNYINNIQVKMQQNTLKYINY